MTAAEVPPAAWPRRSRRWVVLTGRRDGGAVTVSTEPGQVLVATPAGPVALTPDAAVELGDALRAAGGARTRGGSVTPIRPGERVRPDPRPLSPTEVRAMATQLDRLAAVLDEQAGR